MYIQQRTINGQPFDILVVTIVDEEDIHNIEQIYSSYCNIQIELSALHCLEKFKEVDTLIITGGAETEHGMQILYSQKSIRNLILDYEETDSDEGGIELSNFPKLEYVKSRSNLNIHALDKQMCLENGIIIEVLNYYREGKLVKGHYHSNQDILRTDDFIFLAQKQEALQAQ